MIKGQPDWNPEGYREHAGFVAELGEPVVQWLAPRAGERILDLGCGDGALSARLAATGCELVATDANPAFVTAARRTHGLDARVMDARALTFEGRFDAVFSNAVLHWIPAAERVIEGVARALVPGGRFVGELGGCGNCGSIVDALRVAVEGYGLDWKAIDPWYFPTPEAYAALLEQGGFRVEEMASIPRPTALPGDISDWLQTFATGIAAYLPAGQRAALFADVREALRDSLCDRQGRWTVDYVRLRFRAFKTGSCRPSGRPSTG